MEENLSFLSFYSYFFLYELKKGRENQKSNDLAE